MRLARLRSRCNRLHDLTRILGSETTNTDAVGTIVASVHMHFRLLNVSEAAFLRDASSTQKGAPGIQPRRRINMLKSKKCLHPLTTHSCLSAFLVGAFLLFGEVVTAQDQPNLRVERQPQSPDLPPFRFALTPRFGVRDKNAAPLVNVGQVSWSSPLPRLGNPVNSPEGVYRVTLEEAQQAAAGTGNPALRIARLQVEAAKQHRLGVQADYFPKISGVFENLHLNKHTGEILAVRHPLTGGILSFPVNIVNKNQTMFNFSLVQPVTPLFAIHQLVIIARADENIARAKAGMPVAETASKVEKNYFDLLVAQLELEIAEANSKKVQGKWLTAANSGALRISAEEETEIIKAQNAIVLATGKLNELTSSLNLMIGLPEETKLELIPPDPLVENISLEEVAQQAAAVNPEVVEAEQTLVKARAASKLSKMDYVPSVAIIGGYANQTIFNVILPQDFSYIGFMATYNVFDFGKREHTVKERRAQVEAAELAVQLTKSKVAAGVKSSYLQLESSRKLAQLARRMVSAVHFVNASYQTDDPEIESAAARMKADMFRAELEYRQAYNRLKILMAADSKTK